MLQINLIYLYQIMFSMDFIRQFPTVPDHKRDQNPRRVLKHLQKKNVLY